jgi:hypothetical protein
MNASRIPQLRQAKVMPGGPFLRGVIVTGESGAMPARRIITAALLSLAVVAPAMACEGDDCPPSTKVSKPLQLGQFMRPGNAPAKAAPAKAARPAKPHTAPSTVAKAHSSAPKQASVRARKTTPAPMGERLVPTVAPAALPEAASAFAAQQPVPDVQVVDENELNAIDAAAGPALPETNGSAQREGQSIQVVDASDYNDIDRKSAEQLDQNSDEPGPVAVASPPSVPEGTVDAQTGLNWIERFWTRVRYTFVAMAAAWHYVFG